MDNCGKQRCRGGGEDAARVTTHWNADLDDEASTHAIVEHSLLVQQLVRWKQARQPVVAERTYDCAR